MRRHLPAVALACVLFTTVSAGDLHTTDSPDESALPPPPCSVLVENSDEICVPDPEPTSPLVTIILNIISAVTL